VCLAGASPVGAGQAATSAGRDRNFASLRRFWAVAASRNSSLAPFGPRRRSRPSLRIRLRCAKSISIFLRRCRERSKAGVLASDRARSRTGRTLSLSRTLATAFARRRFEAQVRMFRAGRECSHPFAPAVASDYPVMDVLCGSSPRPFGGCVARQAPPRWIARLRIS
jgi:hypothetical protein